MTDITYNSKEITITTDKNDKKTIQTFNARNGRKSGEIRLVKPIPRLLGRESVIIYINTHFQTAWISYIKKGKICYFTPRNVDVRHINELDELDGPIDEYEITFDD